MHKPELGSLSRVVLSVVTDTGLDSLAASGFLVRRLPPKSLQRFPLRRVTVTLQGMSYKGKFTGIGIYITKECDF